MSVFPVPTTLSPSRISSFENCPLQFRFASVEGLPQPPGIHAVKGNVVHRALELLFGLERAERTRDAAHKFMGVAREEYEPTYEITGLNLTDAQLHSFWSECSDLVDGYLAMEDPREVHGVEQEIFVTADLGPFALRGYVDRLERRPDGAIVITDYKTGKSPNPNYPDGKMKQLEMYAYMLREMRGELASLLQLYYVKDGTKNLATPSEQSMNFVRTRTTAMFTTIAKACTTGNFPTKKGGLCNFCAYKDWCPEFGGDPWKAAVEAPLKYPQPPQ